ncbi:MAG TPA: guanylate kinase [Thermopetrobacter sp.]|nr:guanylate kinase [Thermopetrobacter sp.]
MAEVEKDSEAVSLKRRGMLVVLSSPSGAGKSTLSRLLLDHEPELSMSVSVTTRPPRPGEVDGRDYHFIDKEEFARLRDTGGLLEWAEVFGNHYGSPREPVERALEEGRDVLFDVDWQGAQQITEAMGADDVVRIFILPPSAEVLHQRLKKRAQDPPDVIARRMAEAASEISHWQEYDYVIVNDELEAAFERLRAIVRAERQRRHRQVGLFDFVRGMIDRLA